MQGGNGPSSAVATDAATAALSSVDVLSKTLNNDAVTGDAVNADTAEEMNGAAVDPGAPEDTAEFKRANLNLAGGETAPDTNTEAPAAQQRHSTSSSLKAIMGTVASAPAAPKPSPVLAQPEDSGAAVSPAASATRAPLKSSSSSALKSMLDVAGGGANVPGSEGSTGPPNTTAAAAPVHGRAAGTDPTVDIPQLLVEKGGRIRITALWDAYHNRFGETLYTLKDLFGEFFLLGSIDCVRDKQALGVAMSQPGGVATCRRRSVLSCFVVLRPRLC